VSAVLVLQVSSVLAPGWIGLPTSRRRWFPG